MGAFDEGPLADPEHHEPVPHLIPVQERHKVHPPADHDKLEWCLDVIDGIDVKIGAEAMVLTLLRNDAKPLKQRLRQILGDPSPFKDNRLWEIMHLRAPTNQQPRAGTWEEAHSLYREWQAIDDKHAPVAKRLAALKDKRARYLAMQSELESNIEHWEVV